MGVILIQTTTSRLSDEEKARIGPERWLIRYRADIYTHKTHPYIHRSRMDMQAV